VPSSVSLPSVPTIVAVCPKQVTAAGTTAADAACAPSPARLSSSAAGIARVRGVASGMARASWSAMISRSVAPP
jgi:hypothetical protein